MKQFCFPSLHGSENTVVTEYIKKFLMITVWRNSFVFYRIQEDSAAHIFFVKIFLQTIERFSSHMH